MSLFPENETGARGRPVPRALRARHRPRPARRGRRDPGARLARRLRGTRAGGGARRPRRAGSSRRRSRAPTRRRLDGVGALGVGVALLALVFGVVGASQRRLERPARAAGARGGCGGARRVRLVGAARGRPAAGPVALPQPHAERGAPQRDADRARDGRGDPAAALLLPERAGPEAGAGAAADRAAGDRRGGVLAVRGRARGPARAARRDPGRPRAGRGGLAADCPSCTPARHTRPCSWLSSSSAPATSRSSRP